MDLLNAKIRELEDLLEDLNSCQKTYDWLITKVSKGRKDFYHSAGVAKHVHVSCLKEDKQELADEITSCLNDLDILNRGRAILSDEQKGTALSPKRPPSGQKKGQAQSVVADVIKTLPKGTTIKNKLFLSQFLNGRNLDLRPAQSTVDKNLSKMCKTGILERVKHGVYKVL